MRLDWTHRLVCDLSSLAFITYSCYLCSPFSTKKNCACMCSVYMYVFVCAHTRAHVWRSEVSSIRCLLQWLATLFFETGSLTEPGIHYFT